jgi:hypothetical protein
MKKLGGFGSLTAVALVAFGACTDDGPGSASGGDAGEAGEGGVESGGSSTGGKPTAGSSTAGGANGGQSSQSGDSGLPDAGDLNQVGGGGQAGGNTAAGAAGSSGAGGEGGAGGVGPDSTVRWLGNCTPRGLSKDGKTVLADEGVWTAATGWQPIPDLPGGTDENHPRALSADGQVVYGLSGSALGNELYRWTAAAGTEGMGVTHFPMSTNLDGSVLVGFLDDEQGPLPYRWTMAGGFEKLTDSFTLIYSSYIDALVNEAGDVAYYSSTRQSARWTQTDGFPDSGWPGGDQVTAISADGSRVAPYNGFGTFDFQSTGLCSIYFPADGGYSPPYNPPESCFGPYLDEVFVTVLDYDGPGAHAVGIETFGNEATQSFFYWYEHGDQRPLEDLLPGIKLSPIPYPKQSIAKYPPFPPHPYLSDDAHTLFAQDTNGACFLAEISDPENCYRCPPQDPAPNAIQWIGACVPTGFSDDGSEAHASRGTWTAGTGWTDPSQNSLTLAPAAPAAAAIDFGGDCLYADAGSTDPTPCGEANLVITSTSMDGTLAVGNEYRNDLLYREFFWSSSSGLATLDSALVGGTDQLAFPGIFQLEYDAADYGVVRKVFLSKDGKKIFGSNQDGICFIGTVKP